VDTPNYEEVNKADNTLYKAQEAVEKEKPKKKPKSQNV
jgi:hypothetical protein